MIPLWLVLLLLVPLLVFRPWARDVFVVEMRAGRVSRVRGRLPPGLLDEFGDVARTARIRRASIRAVRDLAAARVRLIVRGVDEPTAQRLRNAFGLHAPRLGPGPGVRAS